MRRLVSLFVLSMFATTIHAGTLNDQFISKVMTALESYAYDEKGTLALAPEIARTRILLEDSGISKSFLKDKLANYHPSLLDSYINKIPDYSPTQFKNLKDQMAVSFEAVKISVIEESDDLFGDDIYAYFFVTDGFVTTAKVTGIYKNLSEGEAFFLSLADRKLFPMTGDLGAKGFTNHLIVDMGIVESDGDDIAEAKKLTNIIIDIAIVIIASQAPDVGAEIAKLRKEIKALADFFNDLNKDDRLVTDTIILTYEDLAKKLPGNKTVSEFTKKYSGKNWYSEWSYEVLFRLLK